MGQARVKGSYDERKAAAIKAGRLKKRFGGYVSGHGFLTAWIAALGRRGKREKAHKDRVGVMAAMAARKDLIGRGVRADEVVFLIAVLAMCGGLMVVGVNALLW